MSDYAIRVEHLGKQYRLGGQQASYATFRETLVKAAKAPLRWLKGERKAEKDIIWALDDVSFEIRHGEAVGIIGRNGAGKSTLLKILAQITSPTRGRVDLNGRVGSLLEVGTGFHPELSGRENIFLNGAILGMKRTEIVRKFDEIVDFAEIERFLDTPVKHYSSGMYMRLAFAVAAHLETEILLVDEVLAVGDAEFQKKCLGKMGEVAHEGRTVLFVSHNMAAITQLCKTSLILSSGKVIFKGDVDSGIQQYLKYGTDRKGNIVEHAVYLSDKRIELKNIEINGSPIDEIDLGNDNYQLNINIFGAVKKQTRIALEARLHDATGGPIATFGPAHFTDKKLEVLDLGEFNISGKIYLPILTQGNFYLSLFLTDPSVQGLCDLPYCLSISSTGVPLITYGSTLSAKGGHGLFILNGDFEVNQ